MAGLGSSCGACKFLRRKCTRECLFAPYFCYDQAANHFAAVHKVFGASNVSKLLLQLPLQNRSDASITISYEALARMRDPIYGCVGHILALQQQVANLQEEIEVLGSQMTNPMVGVPSSSVVSPEEFIYLDGTFQYSLQYDINTVASQNDHWELLDHTEYTTGNNVLDRQMSEQLPLYNWEDEKLLLDSQNDPWAALDHTEYTTGKNVVPRQMNEQLPSYGNEDENLIFDSYTNSLSGCTGELDLDTFTYYPWLDMSYNNTNIEGQS